MTDLGPFATDNEKARAERRRVRWAERAELIDQHFPETTDLNWNRALADNDTFARIVRDVLKAHQHADRPEAERSLAGRRPNLDIELGQQNLRDLVGGSFATKPFVEAFRQLTTDRATGRLHSLTAIARKTNISRSRVHRLLTGQDEPCLDDMHAIAHAYHHKPSFFTEYRTKAILAFVANKLEDSPEMSASLYQRISR